MMSETAAQAAATPARWPRRLLWSAATVAVLLGGLWAGVPKAVDYAAGNWAQKLGRKLTLGEVEFAPWAWRLTVHDVRLNERDGTPLFSAARLHVDAEALPLLIGRFELAELTLDTPRLWAARNAQGEWNWTRLLRDAAGPDTEPDEDDGEPPKLLLTQLALNKGQLLLHDQLGGDVQRQVLPLDFQLKNLSTLPNNHGRYRLAAELGDGTKLDWQGSLLLQPLQSDGVLKASGFTLASVWPYVQPHLKLAPPQGKLSVSLPYHFDLAGKTVRLSAKGVAANLAALAVTAPGSGSSFKLGQLALSGGEFDLASRRLTVGRLSLAGGELDTVLDRLGQPDWLAALPPAPAASVKTAAPVKAAVATTKPAGGWTVSLPAIRVDNWQLRAEHRGFVAPLAASVRLDSLQAALAVAADGSVKVGNATLALSQLSAASQGKPAFASLARLQLASSQLDLGKRQLTPGDISVAGLQLAIARNKAGQLDIGEALRPLPVTTTTAPTPAAASAGQPWQIRYPQLTLAQSALSWRDAGTGQPVSVALQDVSASVSGDPQQGFAVQLAAALGQGWLQLDGTLAANLQDIKGKLRASRLPLRDVAPYALDNTVLRFGGGELSADLGFALQGSRWQADGKAALDKLALYEPGRREMLLGWQQLAVSGIKAQPDRISLGDVRLVSPQLRLILDEKRVPNFAHLMKPQPAAKAAPAAKGDSGDKLPLVEVRAVRVRNARMDFADLGLNPSFATRIHSLSGTVLGLSSRPGRRGTVTLDGRVDQFGDVRIRGALSPLAVTNDLDMVLNFRNIPLGSLNPYSMTFAGWKITDGSLSTELRYVLKNRQLQGENRMVIDHIQLGEEVSDYDGTRLPLRLAVALLEDSDGRIDLSLPVAGSLDAPDFSYGHLVWQAFRNIVVKIVTAPFRALFGGEGFDDIYADAGDDRIPPPEREKLLKLAELLAKRPKLALAIGGGYDAEQDSKELARYRVDSDILKRAAYQLQADEPLPLPDMGDPAIRKAVGDGYAVQFGRFAWLKRVASEKDTAERAQSMRAELLAAQKIDDSALQALARARGEAARQLLLAAKPELAERISVLDADKVKADKDGVPLLLKLK